MYVLVCKFYEFKIEFGPLFDGNTFANKSSMKHIKSVQNQNAFYAWYAFNMPKIFYENEFH